MSFAWAAGLYEGEGCLKRDKRWKTTYELKIRMCDLDVLQTFQKFVECGNISPVKLAPKHKHWSPIWEFRVCNQAGIRKILTGMLPYLGLRRAYDAQNYLDCVDGC